MNNLTPTVEEAVAPLQRLTNIATVLSISDSHLLVPFNRVHRLFAWLVDSDAIGPLGCAHVTPRCREWLIEQHPWLEAIQVPDGLDDYDKIAEWIEDNIHPAHRLIGVQQLPKEARLP